MKNAILFDLGNTLVQYYVKSEFPAILAQAISEVQEFLREKDLLSVSPQLVWQRVKDENYEIQDHRVRPLGERLRRIFQLEASTEFHDLEMALCRRFLKPTFARSRRYQDTLPMLRELKSRGFKVAIVSNTPWGSPANLWREEIARHGLSEHMDVVVFCTDIGWRKPAQQIFEYTLERLQVLPQHCVFVGDNPVWDLMGPRAVGIEAILIDRPGVMRKVREDPIRNLHELWDRLLTHDAT
jgi:putative hydrolase of the HAD superfamily